MATIEHDGLTITSNHESEAAMRAVMGVESHEESEHSDGGAGEPVASGTSGEVSDGEDGHSAAGESEVRQAIPEPPKETPKGKPRDNPQARISQAVAKQREAERKAADLEARLQALEQARQTPPPPASAQQPVTQPVATGKPSWKSFEEQIGTTYQTWGEAQDAYADARDSWNRQDWQREQKEQAELTEKRKASTDHLARVEVAKGKYADYDQAVKSVEHVRVSPTLEAAILKLPNSADVVYWLATHPEELTQLASETLSLDVTAAPLVRRLLEARVSAGVPSGSAPSAELSKAKPPVRPVGVSSVTVPDEPGDDEDFDKYFSRMNAADRKRGRL